MNTTHSHRQKKTINATKRPCYFCTHRTQEDVDYKEPQLLKRFISSYGKIAPRRRSGVCARHQRKLSHAIKKARIMALLPFVIQ